MELLKLNEILNELISNNIIDIKNKNEAVRGVSLNLQNSIKTHLPNGEKFGIAFSGGVDSTLIAYLCKKFRLDIKLYTIGIGEKEDLIWARKIANNLKIPITSKVIDYDEAYDIIKKVVNLLKEDHPVKVGIGATLYSVFNMIKNDNLKHAVTGLGSDSIFFGFDKYKRALESGDIIKVGMESMKKIYENDVLRDLAIAKNFNLNLICPYLDKEVIRHGLRIDPKLKINNEEKKIVLREAALSLGLKKEFAFRKKLAAQYGSGFDKAIEVFTKENGFKYKREFLNSLLTK